MAQVFIGTSGYSYKHWRDVFYPSDLPEKKWLPFYCQNFSTVELNATFYHLPQEQTFQSWHENTPANFGFSVKAPRSITHFKKLVNIDEPLKLFSDRLSLLKEKAKVILWQLPPSLEYEKERFDQFCEKLIPLQYKLAFEFRNRSWFNEEVYESLFKLNAAVVQCDWPFLVIEETVAKPKKEVIMVPETADFAYFRRHGATALYASVYSRAQLKDDAEDIKVNIENGRDNFIYFNNDAEGHAVANARELIQLVENDSGS